MTFPTQEQLADLKYQYVGKRIKLISMRNDPLPVPAGSIGTCVDVDGAGSPLMNWDNGRRLALIPCVDKFEIVD